MGCIGRGVHIAPAIVDCLLLEHSAEAAELHYRCSEFSTPFHNNSRTLVGHGRQSVPLAPCLAVV